MEQVVMTTEERKALLANLDENVRKINASINLPVGKYTMSVTNFSHRVTEANADGTSYFLPFAHGEVKNAGGTLLSKGFNGFMVDNADFWSEMSVGQQYTFDVIEVDAKDKQGLPVKRRRTVNWR